jgi:hypothetical protein
MENTQSRTFASDSSISIGALNSKSLDQIKTMSQLRVGWQFLPATRVLVRSDLIFCERKEARSL